MAGRRIRPPPRLEMRGDSANCLFAVSGPHFFKAMPADATSKMDPPQTELMNAHIVARLDPAGERTATLVDAYVGFCITRTGPRSGVLKQCTSNSVNPQVLAVYRALRHSSAETATPARSGDARGSASAAFDYLGALVADFFAWYFAFSTTYRFRHNDMHIGNVVFDERSRRLKMIDFGRNTFDDAPPALVTAAGVRAAEWMRRSSPFDYRAEITTRDRKLGWIRDNLDPPTRSAEDDRTYLPDAILYLSWIARTYAEREAAFRAYPEVGLAYRGLGGDHRWVATTAEETTVAELMDDALVAIAAPETNLVYKLLLCFALAAAVRVRVMRRPLGRSEQRDSAYERLLVDFDREAYDAVGSCTDEAVQACTRRSPQAGGGGPGEDPAVASLIEATFPRDLTRAHAIGIAQKAGAARSASTAPNVATPFLAGACTMVSAILGSVV